MDAQVGEEKYLLMLEGLDDGSCGWFEGLNFLVCFCLKPRHYVCFFSTLESASDVLFISCEVDICRLKGAVRENLDVEFII